MSTTPYCVSEARYHQQEDDTFRVEAIYVHQETGEEVARFLRWEHEEGDARRAVAYVNRSIREGESQDQDWLMMRARDGAEGREWVSEEEEPFWWPPGWMACSRGIGSTTART